MSWLFETPWPAIAIGVLATAMAAGAAAHGPPGAAARDVAIILLTIGAVVLERWVVTDREQVDATLHEIARLVESNDVDAVLRYAYSGSRQCGRRRLGNCRGTGSGL